MIVVEDVKPKYSGTNESVGYKTLSGRNLKRKKCSNFEYY